MTGKPERARAQGLVIGVWPTGPLNAITDVSGVQVGHVTLIEGDRTRTGATAILPHGGNLYRARVPAAFAVLNGYGKFAGSTQLVELGELETPILLTNTLAVGRALEALVAHTLSLPGNERVVSVNAVVGETNDSRLNDIRAQRPTVAEMGAAIAAACSGPVPEGAVGAGTGTVAFGMKGGIGTASRQVGGHALGVLVQSNYGGHLRIDGRPHVAPEHSTDADGSIVIIVATDAPVNARNLHRLAKRSFGGLARTGAALSDGSGDYALAFTTAPGLWRGPDACGGAVAEIENAAMSPLFEAVIECTEEAILNSMLMSEDMQGYDASADQLVRIRALRP